MKFVCVAVRRSRIVDFHFLLSSPTSLSSATSLFPLLSSIHSTHNKRNNTYRAHFSSFSFPHTVFLHTFISDRHPYIYIYHTTFLHILLHLCPPPLPQYQKMHVIFNQVGYGVYFPLFPGGNGC